MKEENLINRRITYQIFGKEGTYEATVLGESPEELELSQVCMVDDVGELHEKGDMTVNRKDIIISRVSE